MKNNLAIIGGDLRTVKLVNILSIENDVTTFGLENSKELKECKNIKQAKTLKEAIKQAKYIIAPMPFSKDGENVHAVYAENKINIEELVDCLHNKTIIAGAIPNNIKEILTKNKTKIFDLMDYEELTILNTIATAEGAVQIAMEKTQKVIHGSKVLVLGLGRVGKTTAQKFAGLSAKVTCAVRKEKDFAWAQVYGYESTNINKLGKNLEDFDIIINTPPTLILTKERLKYVKKDCLIIDLASKPGGIDFDAAKELDLNFDWALALPGRVAPTTAAKHIKQTIDKIIGEEN